MAKIPSTFLKELNDSIVWMSSLHLRAYAYHERSKDKDQPFCWDKCVGLRYAATVVLLKDNIVKGYIKRKKGEALLSRLDEAFKSYASVIFDRQQLVDEALAKLAEIQKDIDLVF